MTLFKSLVLSRLDYGSQLWSPHLVKHIDQLEKIQRSFTKHITELHGLEYSEQLVSLKLSSLQRRCERYCIIYVGKIIEGLVPNCLFLFRAQRKIMHCFTCKFTQIRVTYL